MVIGGLKGAVLPTPGSKARRVSLRHDYLLQEGRFFFPQQLVGSMRGCFRNVRKKISYQGEFLKASCKAKINAVL